MSRRVSLPSADELFRTTPPGPNGPTGASEATATPEPTEAADPADPGAPESKPRRPSGRVRHDEKITVYVTADELLAVEHTRLRLRADHGVAVDRGRLIREAIHLALDDVAENGGDSRLVRRLREEQ